MNELPLVSIICTTFNHEAFIKDALEGFVMQKTSFPFEIIVHDDASSDRTVEIVKVYEEKYPKLFANIYQNENQYSKGKDLVGKIVFNAVRGKYTAFCEGDDYWIDPYKLQKQVDILEKDDTIGLVHTSCKFYDENKKIFFHTQYGDQNDQNYSFEKLFLRNTISTCTTVFRKSLLDNFVGFPQGDLSMWLYFALNSKIRGMVDITGVYRLVDNSLSKWNNPIQRITTLENWAKIQTFYYINYKISSTLIIKKYIEHVNDMLKICIRTRKIFPLFKGFIFLKKEIVEIIKQKK